MRSYVILIYQKRGLLITFLYLLIFQFDLLLLLNMS